MLGTWLGNPRRDARAMRRVESPELQQRENQMLQELKVDLRRGDPGLRDHYGGPALHCGRGVCGSCSRNWVRSRQDLERRWQLRLPVRAAMHLFDKARWLNRPTPKLRGHLARSACHPYACVPSAQVHLGVGRVSRRHTSYFGGLCERWPVGSRLRRERKELSG